MWYKINCIMLNIYWKFLAINLISSIIMDPMLNMLIWRLIDKNF